MEKRKRKRKKKKKKRRGGGGIDYDRGWMLTELEGRREGVGRWVKEGRAKSFKPRGVVEESLRIHLLSATLLWPRDQLTLVSRPEREKFQIWCWIKWTYNSLESVPLWMW